VSWSSYSLGNGTEDFKFPFLCITTCHFWGLVCMLNSCHIIPLSTYYIHSHGLSTLCVCNCSIQFSGVSHWSPYLTMKLHCKVYQSIEKYLIWDETVLLTPGKVGMQPCSRSSRRHHITKSCWIYCVPIHTTSSFFKIPSVYPLDMPL